MITISETEINPLGPYMELDQRFTNSKKNNFFGRRRPRGGFQMVQKCFPDSTSSYFLLYMIKKAILSYLNMPKINFKVLLDEHTFYPKILC